jgi:hypothetical protein
VAHVWWFTSDSVKKFHPCIARRILTLVVSSSLCKQNWSSYSFVHSKAHNRLQSSQAEDFVYVYTNSRVLNQNVIFMDEAATKWYKQSVVSKDSNSNGPRNIFHEYGILFDGDTSDANMDDKFIDDENIGGQWEDTSAVQGFEIGEEKRELHDWLGAMQMHHILRHQQMMRTIYLLQDFSMRWIIK